MTSTNSPRVLTDEKSRDMARYIRDRHWEILQMIADHNPLHICWWDKNRRHDKKDRPENLHVCGLIDGMELATWLRSHPDWTQADEWSDEECAHPFYITDAGREALLNRDQFDMEPVIGGMVEPGWQAVPREKEQPEAAAARRFRERRNRWLETARNQEPLHSGPETRLKREEDNRERVSILGAGLIAIEEECNYWVTWHGPETKDGTLRWAAQDTTETLAVHYGMTTQAIDDLDEMALKDATLDRISRFIQEQPVIF